VLLCLRLAELSVAGAQARKMKQGQEFKSLLQFVSSDCPELRTWLLQRRSELRLQRGAGRCGCCRGVRAPASCGPLTPAEASGSILSSR
jgi:hypothetical protein